MKKTGIRPRVNEAKEFLEIAKDFKDSKELIREALSNSWDANSSEVSIDFTATVSSLTKKKAVTVIIEDDGDGMNAEPKKGKDISDLEAFFNLGDSNKSTGSIGTKGHGTKIYYKSNGIFLMTHNNGTITMAKTDVEPWKTLCNGIVPTYSIESNLTDSKEKGTTITVFDFIAKPSDFSSIDVLQRYITWSTVLGSFGHYFGVSRNMKLHLSTTTSPSAVTIEGGFRFPDDNLDLTDGTFSACKIYGPKKVSCGVADDGTEITLEIVGALLGERHRNIVPETYSHMGLWLCKDYIKIERNNEIVESVLGGQYYYRSMLIFANCQHFDLTANRNNIRKEHDVYEPVVEGIKTFCKEMWDDEFVQNYFKTKKLEDEKEKKREDEKKNAERRRKNEIAMKDRINRYKARSKLNHKVLGRALARVPQNEAETALLLQAMISAEIPEIPFVIGDYNITRGVDMIVEEMDKGFQTCKLVELVYSLDKLYQWEHPPEGYHYVVCYEKGQAKEVQKFVDGQESKLVSKPKPGRYTLFVGDDSIDVFVLSEILGGLVE